MTLVRFWSAPDAPAPVGLARVGRREHSDSCTLANAPERATSRAVRNPHPVVEGVQVLETGRVRDARLVVRDLLLRRSLRRPAKRP